MANIRGRFMYITAGAHDHIALYLYSSVNQSHIYRSTTSDPLYHLILIQKTKKMHAFLSLGLLASSVAASALAPRAENLQPCGNAFYVPSQVSAPESLISTLLLTATEP